MPRGAEKVHRPAELRRAATKARPEAELPRRSVARLARSHPLAGPLLARQAVDLPAAHWAPAVHPGVTLPAAARLKAVPADRRAAARPRAVPAADRAVVPPAADAAARRVRKSEGDKRGGVAFISNLAGANQPTRAGRPRASLL
jgi:hypothetical protein